MYSYRILIEAKSHDCREQIDTMCKMNKCEIIKVNPTEDRVYFTVSTEDPVNFFNLGRMWIDLEDIVNIT